jgi:hypothetical protein
MTGGVGPPHAVGVCVDVDAGDLSLPPHGGMESSAGVGVGAGADELLPPPPQLTNNTTAHATKDFTKNFDFMVDSSNKKCGWIEARSAPAGHFQRIDFDNQSSHWVDRISAINRPFFR